MALPSRRRVLGRPDLAWIGRRVAVFVDGAFWHGHPDYYWGQSGKFWDEKIARNRARDERVNRELIEAGWTVVRLWDFEVERNLPVCVERVTQALHQKGEAASSTKSCAWRRSVTFVRRSMTALIHDLWGQRAKPKVSPPTPWFVKVEGSIVRCSTLPTGTTT